jgi:heme exporter protein A
VVVANFTFEVRAGGALILKGPNGSGKTTLLRTIAGFLPTAAGQVQIDRGLDGAGDERTYHYVGHANAVKPRLSVLENVRFWQRYYGGADDWDAAEGALSAFGILDLADYRAGHLSQGQARRLGLARLLAAPRPVWLLDEPTVSLDAASSLQLERVVADHLSGGGLAIVSTHLDLKLPGAAVLTLGGSGAT